MIEDLQVSVCVSPTFYPLRFAFTRRWPSCFLSPHFSVLGRPHRTGLSYGRRLIRPSDINPIISSCSCINSSPSFFRSSTLLVPPCSSSPLVTLAFSSRPVGHSVEKVVMPWVEAVEVVEAALFGDWTGTKACRYETVVPIIGAKQRFVEWERKWA